MTRYLAASLIAALLACPAAGRAQTAVTRPPAQQQPDTNVTTIDWAAAERDRQVQTRSAASASAARSQTTVPAPRNASPQDLQEVRLPVLIPSLQAARTSRAGDQGMLVFPNEDFYTASMTMDGLLVEVSGSRRINTRIADPLEARRLRAGQDAEGFRVTSIEGGQTVDFSRYGAAYSVTLECARPDDLRCADPNFAIDMARRLVIAGGSPDRD